MFLSGFVLKNTIEKYQRSKRKERYSSVASKDSSSTSIKGILLVLAIIFFFMELIVFYYAIAIAFSCTQQGPERIVNIVLAIALPFPYVMLNILFNECAKSRLKQKN